ncbi:MAG: hypothetical protein ACP5NG_05025, partial [Conexivisphaera sp.]
GPGPQGGPGAAKGKPQEAEAEELEGRRRGAAPGYLHVGARPGCARGHLETPRGDGPQAGGRGAAGPRDGPPGRGLRLQDEGGRQEARRGALARGGGQDGGRCLARQLLHAEEDLPARHRGGREETGAERCRRLRAGAEEVQGQG